MIQENKNVKGLVTMKKFLIALLTLSLVVTFASGAIAAKKYAVILKTTNSDFWRTMHDGTAKYAKDNGLDVDMFAAQSDVFVVCTLQRRESYRRREESKRCRYNNLEH